MPVEIRDFYTAFRQESSGLERLYEGRGLGLTITQHLVEMLGGEITVDSTKHEGTTFVVSLPGDLAEPIQPSNGGDTQQEPYYPQRIEPANRS